MKKKKIIIGLLASSLGIGASLAAVFGQMNQEQFKIDVELAQQIQADFNEYSNKYLIKDDSKINEITNIATKEVGNYVEKLFNENKISSYLISEEGIVIKNKCGVVMSFSPTIENTYGDLKPVLNITKVVPNQLIYSEQKEVSGEDEDPKLPDGFKNDGELIPAVAKDLANEFEHVTYDEKDLLQDQVLSKEFLQSLGRNQVVIICGHGTYVPGYHSTLNTGRREGIDWIRYLNDKVYRNDCDNGYIVNTPGGEAFTPAYLEKYVGDLTNTFIYFGNCESAKDNMLATTLLNKGAAAVIANTEEISMRYGDMMQYTTIKNLLTKKDNRYLTIGEALQTAKDKYGECDPKGMHSVPTLFGNPNYSLDKALIAPVYKEYVTYTGEDIELIAPGIGFHFDSSTPNYGKDARQYFVKVILEEGYAWPDPETPKEDEYSVTINKKPVTFDDMVIPVAQTNLSTDGRNVKLFTPGSCDFGTFEYLLDGSEEYYWTENIPEVNKPGKYTVSWRFMGDKNHGDLGNDFYGFKSEIEVKASPNTNTIPVWVLVLLVAIGLAILITLTVLTGKKVKKLAKEREDNILNK